MALQQEQVITALRQVRDPGLGKDLVTLGMVKKVEIKADDVVVSLELATPQTPLEDSVRKGIEQAVKSLGAANVTIDLTSKKVVQKPAAPERPLSQVRNVIAVGAGKGGVGKSTIAVNLAIGLSLTGAKVGLMDGDIYGPSMPTMLGIKGRVPELNGSKIIPLFVHGIHAITIGSLVEQDKPLIWRGPMAHGAFKQLLADNTLWPTLDYLIVDLPPGTGDVPLTLCQLLPLTGAVVVATPQQVALDDAVRAVKMFQHLGTAVLGIVENMSYFISPDGAEYDIFGRGGAESASQTLSVPYLGNLPMFTQLRINSDSGKPLANFEGDPRLRQSLEQLVQNLMAQVNLRKSAGPQLTIS